MVTPVLCAALSSAFSFYFFSFAFQFFSQRLAGRFFLFFLFIALVSLCFLRAVLSHQVFLSKSARYQCRRLRVFAVAAFLGFFIGFGVGKPSFPSLGLARENISGVYGVLLDDPRSFSSANGAAQGAGGMLLKRVTGSGGLDKASVSAFGMIRVFFPEGAIPRLKEFGRRSEVYLEGGFAPDGERFWAKAVHIVKPAPAIEQFRTKARLNIAERFSAYRWGHLALALLFGVKDGLDSELSRQYRSAGCSHVLALSGMHLAVLSALLAFLLKKPLGLRLSALVSAVFIIGYIYFVGNLPSLNRAALMYLLGTLAILAHLPREPLSLLSLSFLLQIILTPEDGKSLSFILSYSALAGILVLSEPLFSFFRGKIPDIIGAGLAASIAAFLGTAVVSAAVFGVLRPVGIIAGLIIVPLTTLFMIGALFALAAGFIAPPALSFIGHALSLLYDILERLVSFAGLAPPLNISSAGAGFLTAGLIFFIFFAYNRQKRCLSLFLERRRSAAA